MALKKCSHCKKIKSTNEFSKNKSKKDGFRTNCKECEREIKRKYKINFKIRKGVSLRVYERMKNPFKALLKNLIEKSKYRASKNSMKFDLNISFIEKLWIKQNGKCALSGLEMTYIFGKGKQVNNASLDRIDSSKGYIQENVQLVCRAVNVMKSDLSQDEFINYCKNISNLN